MAEYEEIATEIVRKHIAIVGSYIALDHARRVPGTVIGDDGSVSHVEGPQSVDALVSEFSGLLGPAAVAFSKSAISPILSKYPNVVLPQSLI